MAATYNVSNLPDKDTFGSDLTDIQKKDSVRFLIKDNKDPFKLEDEEILFMIGRSVDMFWAAADLWDIIRAGVMTKKIGRLQITYVKEMDRLSRIWRRRGFASIGPGVDLESLSPVRVPEIDDLYTRNYNT